MLAIHKTQQLRSWLVDLFFLASLLGFFYLCWLGSHALFTPDEGRYSEVAREMIVSGDYITPRLNGVVFLDKPVLYYWLQAFAIKLFGVKEWALRFWPAFFGVIGCLVSYIAGHLLFSRRTGILAAIILAANPLYYGAAHYANLDLEVAVLISNTLLFAVLGLQASSAYQRTSFLLLAYAFSALAVLTKGLIGLAFPIMVIGSWIILLNRWQLLLKMRLVSGFLIFTSLVLPWYLLAQHANPQFFHFFFITQQFERFLTKANFNNPSHFWFYLPIVLSGFLPWSIFLLQAITQQIKAVWQNRQQHAAGLFLLLWCAIIFIFFSFPKSKTIGYILPIFPALSLITANYLDRYWYQPKAKGIIFAKITFAILCIAIITACFIVPNIKAIELPPRLINYLHITAILFLVGSMLFLYVRNNISRLFYCLTLIITVFLFILLTSAGSINQKTIKPLALQIKTIATPQDEIVTYYRYYQDLPIYLERRITIVADWHASDIVYSDNWVRELWFGIPFQDTANWLIEEPVFWQHWHSQKRLFVLLSTQDYENFNKTAKHHAYKLGNYNDVVLLSNKK